jgi:hypothetical protein
MQLSDALHFRWQYEGPVIVNYEPERLTTRATGRGVTSATPRPARVRRVPKPPKARPRRRR